MNTLINALVHAFAAYGAASAAKVYGTYRDGIPPWVHDSAKFLLLAVAFSIVVRFYFTLRPAK